MIPHCVWLYLRFPLSFREVEELVLERGVIVSYETARRWCAKFGQAYAGALRRRRPRPGDTWHLDEVFIEVNGELKHLWRAVDQDGMVLDILVPDRRDTAADRRFFRRLLKKTRTAPRAVVTDKPRSCGAAHREVMPSVEHRCHKGLNHRAENSHQPTRQREHARKGFAIGRRRAAVPGRVQRHLTSPRVPPPPVELAVVLRAPHLMEPLVDHFRRLPAGESKVMRLARTVLWAAARQTPEGPGNASRAPHSPWRGGPCGMGTRGPGVRGLPALACLGCYLSTPAPVVVASDVGRLLAEASRPVVRVGVQLTVVFRSLDEAAL
ncbi:hypothetical protein SUDANB126_06965 [Streptomyces sp. enrichment culture]